MSETWQPGQAPVWAPGMLGHGPHRCPICDSTGTAYGMPEHLYAAHLDRLLAGQDGLGLAMSDDERGMLAAFPNWVIRSGYLVEEWNRAADEGLELDDIAYQVIADRVRERLRDDRANGEDHPVD